MSLLDNFNEQANELSFWKFISQLHNVYGIELDDRSDFIQNIQSIGDQEKRPVYTLDCKTLKKHDAIGFLERLRNPSAQKPVVVIQNITEIPIGDGVYCKYVGDGETFNDVSIYDDPQYVENILVHSWKNETNYLTNKNGEQFVLKSHDYTVFLTWSSKTSDTIKNVWHASDGFAWIGNLNDHKKAFCDSLKSRDYRELKDVYDKLNS